jgi:hypothetical protein
MKLDLLTNATVVDDAIRFVSSQTSKDDSKPSPGDINEDEDRLEEKQEEETGEITINQVF